MNIHIDNGHLVPLDEAPRTIELPAGSAVFLVRGEVWLTEDGQREDVILRAGMRYDVRGSGPLVLSATASPAELFFVPPAQARLSSASHLQPYLTARAMWLREAEGRRAICASLQALRLWLVGAMRRLLRAEAPQATAATAARQAE